VEYYTSSSRELRRSQQFQILDCEQRAIPINHGLALHRARTKLFLAALAFIVSFFLGRVDIPRRLYLCGGGYPYRWRARFVASQIAEDSDPHWVQRSSSSYIPRDHLGLQLKPTV
jgi:hypothetical protein